MYQKDLNMSYLLDFYGEAIPDKHREIMSQYYEEDLSLSEIAEIFGISRQGARHLIKKGEEQLLFLEEKLGLAKRHRDNARLYAEFQARMTELGEALKQNADNVRSLKIYEELSVISQQLNFD